MVSLSLNNVRGCVNMAVVPSLFDDLLSLTLFLRQEARFSVELSPALQDFQ